MVEEEATRSCALMLFLANGANGKSRAGGEQSQSCKYVRFTEQVPVGSVSLASLR